MPKGKGHEVICPGCRESYHETTKIYKPNRDANAGMLRLKAIYKSYGWDEPVPDPTAGYGILICPDCEAPLAPSGRLEVRLRELPGDTKEILADTPSGDRLAIDRQQVQSETVLICPKCQTPVVVAEGDKMAICPTHGEIPIEELVSTEASVDKTPAPFNVGSIVKAAQDREKEVSVDKRDIFGVPPGQIEVVQQDDKGEIKAFVCPHCNREFKKKANLGSHMRVHKKE